MSMNGVLVERFSLEARGLQTSFVMRKATMQRIDKHFIIHHTAWQRPGSVQTPGSMLPDRLLPEDSMLRDEKEHSSM